MSFFYGLSGLILFRMAMKNYIRKYGKQAHIEQPEQQKSGGKTQAGNVIPRFNDKFEAYQRDAGQGLLEHIIYRGDCRSGFFIGVLVDVVDVGNGKGQLETDADADKYQTGNGNIRHSEIKTQNHAGKRI